MAEDIKEKIAKEWARRWKDGMNRIAPPDSKGIKELRVKNFEKGILKFLGGEVDDIQEF